MKTASASSPSATHAPTKSRTTTRRASTRKKPLTITAKEFDRRADLPSDDPEGDLEPYLDWSKARRPGREVQRVNVDFPVDLLREIDREAARLGVARQAFIKMRVADALPTKKESR